MARVNRNGDNRKIYKYPYNDVTRQPFLVSGLKEVKNGDYCRLEEPDGTLVGVMLAKEDAYYDEKSKAWCIEGEPVNGNAF